MLPLQERRYTIEDIEALGEGKRAELTGGKLYMMAAPSATHQRILMWLALEIGLYLREKKGGCEVFPAPFAVYLDEGAEEKYFEPDICVVCDRGRIDEKGCHGAPDWIIEIVSPASRSMDYYTKLTEYKNGGVREYWIVNPMNESILVYGLEAEEAPIIYRFGDRIRSGIYSGLEIDFGRMKETL